MRIKIIYTTFLIVCFSFLTSFTYGQLLTVSFKSPATSQDEGDSAQLATNVSALMVSGAVTIAPVTVYILVEPGVNNPVNVVNAISRDITASTVLRVTIPAGDYTTPKEVTKIVNSTSNPDFFAFQVLGDTRTEPDETIKLTILDPATHTFHSIAAQVNANSTQTIDSSIQDFTSISFDVRDNVDVPAANRTPELRRRRRRITLFRSDFTESPGTQTTGFIKMIDHDNGYYKYIVTRTIDRTLTTPYRFTIKVEHASRGAFANVVVTGKGGGPNTYLVGTQAESIHTLTNDDADITTGTLYLRLEAVEDTVTEGSGKPAQFRFVLYKPDGTPATAGDLPPAGFIVYYSLYGTAFGNITSTDSWLTTIAADYDGSHTDIDTPRSLPFPSGALKHTLDITITNDTDSENPETIIAEILYTNNNGIIIDTSKSVKTITLLSDETSNGVYARLMRVSGSTTFENENPKFKIALFISNQMMQPGDSRLSTDDLEVFYSITGSVSSGVDYMGNNSRSVILPGGENMVEFEVPLIDDNTIGPDKTMTLTVNNHNGPYSLSGNTRNLTRTVTIKNEDIVEVSLENQSYDEGATDTSLVYLTVKGADITGRAETFSTVVSITTSTVGMAGLPSDFSVTGSATVSSTTILTVEIPKLDYSRVENQRLKLNDIIIKGDRTVENDESFEISVTSVSPVNGGLIKRGAMSTSTVTINNDDYYIKLTREGPDSIAESTPDAKATFKVALYDATGAITTPPAGLSAITVTYTIAGTATVSSDYAAIATKEVIIAAGSVDQTFEITLIDDTLVEPDETITVTLTGPTTGSPMIMGTPAENTQSVTINSDDKLTLSVADATIDETDADKDAPMQITVSGANLTAVTPVAVTITVKDGTAASPTDYSIGNARTIGVGFVFVIPAKDYTVAANQIVDVGTVNIKGNDVFGGNKTFTLEIAGPAPPASAMLGAKTSATYTIDDDENMTLNVNFATANTSQNEGTGSTAVAASGLSGITVDGGNLVAEDTVYVRVSGGDSNPIELTFRGTSLSPANLPDYRDISPIAIIPVVIPKDDYTTPQTISLPTMGDVIQVVGDSRIEPNEEIKLTLLSPSEYSLHDMGKVVTGGTYTTTFTDFEYITFEVLALGTRIPWTVTKAEFESPVTRDKLTIYVHFGSSQSVNYAKLYVTSRLVGGFYEFVISVDTTINFANISNVVIKGTPPENAGFTSTVQSTSTHTLTNDDSPLTLSVADAEIPEGDAPNDVSLQIKVSGGNLTGNTAPVTVMVTVANGTGTNPATSPTHYTLNVPTGTTRVVGSPFPFTIPAGDYSTEQTLEVASVNIKGNTEYGGDKTFTLTIANPTPTEAVTLGATTSATYTIKENEPEPSYSIRLETVTVGDVAESASSAEAQFRIKVYKISDGSAVAPADITAPFTVDYDISGDATAGVDYTEPTSKTVSFVANEVEKDINIAILNDNVIEVNETITLKLASTTANTITTVISDAPSENTQSVTITSEDKLTVSVADADIPEGDGPNDASLQIMVSGANLPAVYTTTNPVTVQLTITDGTAISTGGTPNYTINDGPAGATRTSGTAFSFTIRAADYTQAGNQIVRVPDVVNIKGNTEYGGDKTFGLMIANLAPTASAMLGTKTSATYTIKEDENLTLKVAFAEAATSQLEGDSGIATLTGLSRLNVTGPNLTQDETIYVLIEPTGTNPVSFDYVANLQSNVGDVSLAKLISVNIPSADYETTPTMITIPTTSLAGVAVIGDTRIEQDETFKMTILDSRFYHFQFVNTFTDANASAQTISTPFTDYEYISFEVSDSRFSGTDVTRKRRVRINKDQLADGSEVGSLTTAYDTSGAPVAAVYTYTVTSNVVDNKYVFSIRVQHSTVFGTISNVVVKGTPAITGVNEVSSTQRESISIHTITNDDAYTIKLEKVSTDTVAENPATGITTATQARFKAVLYDGATRVTTSRLTQDVTIAYTVGGTATEGQDHTGGVSGTVVLDPGDFEVPIDIELINDNLVEDDETVIVTLTEPAATDATALAKISATPTDNRKSVTITSEDRLTITVENQSVAEGNADHDEPVQIKVVGADLTTGYSTDVTVQITITDGTDATTGAMSPTHYTINDGPAGATRTSGTAFSFIIPAADYTQASIQALDIPDVVNIKGNTTTNESLQFTVSLSAAAPTAVAEIDATSASASYTIVDDDGILYVKLEKVTTGDIAENVPPNVPPNVAEFRVKVYKTADDSAAVGSDITEQFTVDYVISGDVVAGDYTEPMSRQVSFNAGETEKIFGITILDDNIVEADEAMTLTMTATRNWSAVSLSATAADNTKSVTITSEDKLTISVENQSVAEGNGDHNEPIQIKVVGAVLTTGYSTAVTVMITVANVAGVNGASSPTDYTMAGTVRRVGFPFSFTIPPADYTQASIQALDIPNVVTIKGNTIAGGNKQFTVSVSAAAPTAVAEIDATSASASYTITDDDGLFYVKLEKVTMVDIAESATPAVARFRVKVYKTADDSAAVGSDITEQFTVDYVISGDVVAGDYTEPMSRQVSFNAGETEKIFGITILDDNIVEADEVMTLTMTATRNWSAVSLSATATDNTKSVTITSDDKLTISVEDQSVAEGNADHNEPLQIKVVGADLTGYAPNVTVMITVANGAGANGASSPTDYTMAGTGRTVDTPFSFTIPAADYTQASIQALDIPDVVNIKGNTTTNESLQFTVSLSAAAPTAVAEIDATSASASYTIVDDDGILYVKLEKVTTGDIAENVPPNVPPNVAEFRVKVYKTADDSEAVGSDITEQFTVDYVISGDVVAGDYTEPTLKQVSFNAGDTEKTFGITILDDDIVEDDEVMTLTMTATRNWSAVSLSATATDNTKSVTITSDDKLTISVEDQSVAEGNADHNEPLQIKVVGADLTGYAPNVTVMITVANGAGANGASSPTDYTMAGTGRTVDTPFSFTIPAADYTQASIQALDIPDVVNIKGNTTTNESLQFTVSLSAAAPTAVAEIDATSASASYTIVDDDGILYVKLEKVTTGDIAENVPPNVPPNVAEFRVKVYKTADDSEAVGSDITEQFTVVYVISGDVVAGDYTEPTLKQVSFNAGEIVKTFAITILDDNIVEDDETMTLTMTATRNWSAVSLSATATDNTKSVTITSEDVYTIKLEKVTTGNVDENAADAKAQFKVVLYEGNTAVTNSVLTTDVTVTYDLSGSATEGDDYTAITTQEVVIATGSFEQTFDITLTDDTMVESDETIIVTLTGPTTAGVPMISSTATDNTKSVTITSDDKLTLSVANADIPEGDAPNDASLQITVSGANLPAAYATTNPVTVQLTITDGAGANGATSPTSYSINDGQAGATRTSGTAFSFTIPSGDYTTAVPVNAVTVNIKGDDTYLGDKTFTLDLANPTPAAAVTLGTSISATYTIKEDENAYTLKLTRVGTGSIDESATNAKAVFKVALYDGNTITTSLPTTDVTVNYEITSSSTATAGEDYIAPNAKTVVIASGSVEQNFEILLKDDKVIEGEETLVLKLISSTPALLSTLSTELTESVTITSDDSLMIAILDQNNPEGDTQNNIPVKLKVTGADITNYNVPVTVKLNIEDGTGDDAAVSTGTSPYYSVAGRQAGIPFTVNIPKADYTNTGKQLITVTDIIVSGNVQEETTKDFSASILEPLPTAVATLGKTAATYMINNDDSGLYVKLEKVTSGDVAESATPAVAQFRIKVYKKATNTPAETSDVATAFNVEYKILGEVTAEDYTDPASKIIAFAAGNTEKTFDIVILDDTIVEDKEALTVKLSSVSILAVGMGSAAGDIEQSVSITSEDQLTVSVVAQNVVEGNLGASPLVNIHVEGGIMTGDPASVTLTVADGTALSTGASVDYIVNGNKTFVVMIPSGDYSQAASQNVLVQNILINGDTIDESDETLSLTLSSPSAKTILKAGETTATYTIVNDDYPTFTIKLEKVTTGDVAENSTDAKAEFRLALYKGSVKATAGEAGLPTKATNVTYEILTSSTATASQDYINPTSKTITLLAGSIEQAFSIPIINDNVIEDNETLAVKLLPTATGEIALSNTGIEQSVTITSEDQLVVSVENQNSPEGNADNQVPVKLKVTGADLSGYTGIITVQLTISDGIGTNGAVSTPATTADYTLKSTLRAGTAFTVTIPPADYTSVNNQMIDATTVTLKGNTAVEQSKTFTLGVATPTPSAIAILGTAAATFTINNDDSSLYVKLEKVTMGDVAESASPATAQFKIKVYKATDDTAAVEADVTTPFNVDYTILGNVTVGEDYTNPTSKQVSFNVRDIEKTIDITILNDNIIEDNESFTIKLTTVSIPSVGMANTVAEIESTVTITSEDLLMVSVEAQNQNEGNTGTTMPVNIKVTGGVMTGMPATVMLTATDGTGTNGAVSTGPNADYSITNGMSGTPFMVSIPAGDYSITSNQMLNAASIKINGDLLLEESETIALALSSPSDKVMLETGKISADYTINNDEKIIISIADQNSPEGDADNQVPVKINVAGADLTGYTGGPVTVQLTLTDATAVSNTDYTFASGTSGNAFSVTIPLADYTRAGNQRIDATTVTIKGNSAEGNSKHFALGIATPSPALVTMLGASAAIYTINDDDSDLYVKLEKITTGDISEGTTGAKAQFSVKVYKKTGNTPAVPADVTTAFAVDYNVLGTATAGLDYIAPLTKTLSFKVGTIEQLFDIEVLDDNIIESNETLTVKLSSVSLLSIGMGNTNADLEKSVTITSDDQLTVFVENQDSPEGNSDNMVPVKLKVTGADLTGYTGDPVTVQFTITDGTAVSNTDYTFSGITGNAFTVTIPPADYTQTNEQLIDATTVTIKGNTAVAPSKTFALSIATPSPTAVIMLGTAAATYTINNDDSSLYVKLEKVTVGDVNESTLNAAAQFRIKVYKASDNTAASAAEVTTAFMVDYTILGDVTAEDYTNPTSKTLSFAMGDTEQLFSINVSNDMLIEDNETLTVKLTTVSLNAVSLSATKADIEKSVTIVSEDQLTVSISDSDGAEGNTGTLQPININVSGANLSNYNKPVTVTLVVTGTATIGTNQDYSITNGILGAANTSLVVSIPAADYTVSANQMVNVTDLKIIGDTNVEVAETIIINLASPSPVSLVRFNASTATYTINNDDNYTVKLEKVSADMVSESPTGSKAEFKIVLYDGNTKVTSSILTTALTINYNITGTTIAGDDYTDPSPKTVTLVAGSVEQILSIDLIDDNIYEVDETLTVTLSSVTGGGITASLSTTDIAQTITITSEDIQPFTIKLTVADNMATVNENDANAKAKFVVAMYNGDTKATTSSAPTFTVTYAIATTSTATAPQDYTDPTPKTLTFATGTVEMPIDIDIINDSFIESDEALTVLLVNGTNISTDVTETTKSVTIVSDDRLLVSLTDSSNAEGNINPSTPVNINISGADMTGYTNPITVILTATDGTASSSSTPADYTIAGTTSGTAFNVTIPAKDYTLTANQTMNIPDIVVNGDKVFEGDETFTVVASVPPTQSIVTLDTQVTGIYTILNDDYIVKLNTITPGGAILENATDAKAQFEAVIYKSATEKATASDVGLPEFTFNVTFEISGDATAGEDYTDPTSKTITFTKGTLSQPIAIVILDDGLIESTETLTVTLSGIDRDSNDEPIALSSVAEEITKSISIESDDSDNSQIPGITEQWIIDRKIEPSVPSQIIKKGDNLEIAGLGKENKIYIYNRFSVLVWQQDNYPQGKELNPGANNYFIGKATGSDSFLPTGTYFVVIENQLTNEMKITQHMLEVVN